MYKISLKWKVAFAVMAGMALFVGANIHLVYVAIQSQPDCVDHVKTPVKNGVEFKAAKSSC